jgi:hypothetical protein
MERAIGVCLAVVAVSVVLTAAGVDWAWLIALVGGTATVFAIGGSADVTAKPTPTRGGESADYRRRATSVATDVEPPRLTLMRIV